MLSRTFKTTVLLSVLALPLYASRERNEHPRANMAELPTLSTTPFPEHFFEGHSIPRKDYETCVAALPALAKKLQARGFRLTESFTCTPIDGSVDNYAALIRAWSPHKSELRQVVGALYNSEAICENVAEKMGAELGKTDVLIEEGCAETKGATQMSANDLVFQPYALLLDNP